MASNSDDSNHHPWKRTAWEARQAVSEALVALPSNYSPHKSIGVSEYHELAQTYLFEYFSVFEPKKDQFGGDTEPDSEDAEQTLWWEPVCTVRMPVDGQVQLNGNSDMLKDGSPNTTVLASVSGKIPQQPIRLSLGNVRDFYETDSTVQIEVRGWVENQGTETRTVTDTRFLPVTGIRAIRGQLDRCLEMAGWLPEVTPNTGDGVITEDDVQFAPDEVKERILPDGGD